MQSAELRLAFLNFFKEKGHTIIPSASLLPENDPTALFTMAGMHPLVPFLLGESHPGGKRLANVQICIRTGDIDEVGDEIHHTFLEMLGNWSLGDYFKEEAIKLSFEFLTDKRWLAINKEKLAVTVFEGNKGELDDETKKTWICLGIPKERIKELKDNFWGPAGQTGPCGPDTEIFYWVGNDSVPKEFNPEDKRWVEIWNNVFMQYFKNLDGKYESLVQKNVDTGMGFERTLSIINGLDDNYKTDVFWPIVQEIEKLSQKKYEDNKKEFRIIADHIKAATFIIGDRRGVEPSNLGQGYVARRLIRRAVRYGKTLNLSGDFLTPLVKKVVEIYGNFYTEIKLKENYIIDVIKKEEEKFEQTIEQGLKEFEKMRPKFEPSGTPFSEKTGLVSFGLSGDDLFNLYSTYGFPIELSIEEVKKIYKKFNAEKGAKIVELPKDVEENLLRQFYIALEKHQELSRTASAGMFKGGLADSGEKAARYHTATHLLLAALREVLGDHIYQRGSNITAERMRFDFSYPQKMTLDEIKKAEDIVNQKIKEDIPIVCAEMSLDEAKKKNILGIFEDKYGDKVKTYVIEEFSREICGGPHANRTSELGHFKIIKEESSAAGVRRIKAVLE